MSIISGLEEVPDDFGSCFKTPCSPPCQGGQDITPLNPPLPRGEAAGSPLLTKEGLGEVSKCNPARTAVSIGIFDGVHLGHRSLLAALRSEAERVSGPAVVLTFDRHPMELLAPERAPLYINTVDQKLKLLEQAGADMVVLARFGHAIADISPEKFVEEILVGRLKAAAVVVGSNFRFGHKRTGDVDTLRTLGEEYGIRVVSVEPAVVHGGPVSSTRVRNALTRGDVEAAAQLLGSPFTMLGRVVKGQGMGRKLGFPTANIDVAPRQLVPKDGVYAVRTIFDDKNLPGVCNIGLRPTLNGHSRTIETYIDGFKGDIYGVELATAFQSRLRDEAKFESLEALAEQIARDVEAARAIGYRISQVFSPDAVDSQINIG